MPFDEEYYEKIVGKTPQEIQVERKAFLAKFARCRKTADEMTEFIRQEKPDYYFQKPTGSELRARRALMKNARNTMLDAVEDMLLQPYSAAGRKLYHLDRESGYHLGTYIHNHMQDDEAELLELAEKGPEAENYSLRCQELHRKVLMHVVANIDEYKHQIAGKSDAELVRDWKDVYSILKLCDYQNSVEKFSCFSEKEMEPIGKVMGPMVNMLATTVAKMACIANDAYPVSDPTQLLTMSKPQLSALQSAMEPGFYTAKGVPAANSGSMFNTAYTISSNKVAAMLAEVDKRVGAEGKLNDFTMAQTVDGRRIDADDISREIITNGRPVYVMKVNGPKGLPVMVFMKDGEYVFDDDARKAFLEAGVPQEPTPPDESRRPRGLWDRFCKALGLESWRSAAARQYDADMEKYELEHRLYEEKREFYQKTEQLQQDLTEKDSTEKLKTIRDEMFMAKYNETAAQYVARIETERLAAEQEEARKQAEAKAKEDAKARIAQEKQQKQAMFDEKINKVAALKPEQKKILSKWISEDIKKADRLRGQLETYEEKKLPKTTALAAGMALYDLEKCILQGLDDMAQKKPTSEEFNKILNTAPKKVEQGIFNKVNDLECEGDVAAAVRQMGNELSREEALQLCSFLRSEELEQKIVEFKEKCGVNPPANQPMTEETTLQNGTEAREKVDKRTAEDMTKRLTEIAEKNGFPPEQISDVVAQVQEQVNQPSTETANLTEKVVEENAAEMQQNLEI